ncbi:hypothetical protein HZC53_05785 [Candidatus Uhrbacteria bacterium]|nr:hypothetical protein [Candidatus Uhrbacteria bacterium]
MQKATDKQVALLEKFGITGSYSKAVASKMIEYILRGNGTGGDNEFVRAARLRTKIATYLHQRVRYIGSSRLGTVTSIWPRSFRDVAFLKKLPNNETPCIFQCAVRWDDGKSGGNVSLAFVEPVQS